MRTVLFLLMSINLFAGELIKPEKEALIISNLVKSLKKDAWERGHDAIEADYERFDSKKIITFIEKEMIHMEEELYEEDIINYKNCTQNNLCKLYKVNISSEFYAGFGFDYHFIMLNLETGKVISKSYTGYNE